MQAQTIWFSAALFVATVLELGFLVQVSNQRGMEQRYSYLGADHPQALPAKGPLRYVAMYDHNTVHLQMSSARAAREWELQSPGGGLVYLGPNKRPFMVGMFHQIRCLDVIRRAILHSSSQPDFAGVNGTEGPELLAQTRHCMNYLRQMVLCQMNTRLEWVTSVEPRRSVWEEDYVCLDWSAAYEMVKANQEEYAEWTARHRRHGMIHE